MTQTFIPADMVIYKTKDRTRVCEPTLIAFDSKTYKILAVGAKAATLNCDGESTICVSPFHFGIIDDFTVATKFIKDIVFLFAGAKKVDFYKESLEELLSSKSQEEIRGYTAILAITKEKPAEYACELMQETYERMQLWGLSKEQMIEMLKEL